MTFYKQPWHLQHSIRLICSLVLYNRPFYSCVLSFLAMNASEAGVELALIKTSLSHVNAN